MKWVLYGGVVTVIVVFLSWIAQRATEQYPHQQNASQPSSRRADYALPSETSTLRSQWYCSPGSEDHAVQLNQAIAHQDMLAAAGHAKRNGAFNLETGTKLHII